MADKHSIVKELQWPFDGEYIVKKKRSIKKKLLAEDTNRIKKKIAILGGSTTNDIRLMLEIFLLYYGIEPEFYESEYNQYYQDIIFDNPKLIEFKPDIIYIHTSIHNITCFPDVQATEEEVSELLELEYRKYFEMWQHILGGYRCPIIQNNFEYPMYRLLGNREAYDIHGKINFVLRLNMKFYEYAVQHTHFHINDINYLSACYGLDKWADPFYWHMYKYSCCVPAIPELAFNIAKIIKAIYGKNKKGLVLDLDNTLWGGIVGDDGAEKLVIGQETSMGQVYWEFQRYIKELQSIGVLLTIDSKNDYKNAIAGLGHPDNILKKDDFLDIKANWESKDKNFIDIAEELNLLPESLVFVDDNPAERQIVALQVEGATVPSMTKPEEYIRILDKSGYFEVIELSGDDLKRNEMYKGNLKRQKQKSAFASYDEYLLSLDMRAQIRAFEDIYVSRISQLTNKSNQFNLTTKRYTQSEIEEMKNDLNYITLYGKLEDQFGDNGVVSVIIGRIDGNELHIELWIMSCRVLKRNMEFAMMDVLISKCRKQNIRKIRGFYYPTAKNAMVREFYAMQGFEKVSEDEIGNTEWIFDIRDDYVNKNKVITVEE